ncbi:MAG: DNA-3-methyladenine glycosylase [Burkholderiales bacterium]|nr:DNA-3-methyladenine glycosylase [Burkholderiales bacterium]
MILSSADFINNDTIYLAQKLIGKYVVRKFANNTLAKYLITEVEAYHSMADKANHARFGKTNRTEVLFKTGGRWYVTLCYGVHYLLNLVTGEEGNPSAVLIRGINEVVGPGKVTKLLKVDRSFNNLEATENNNLWLEDHNFKVQNITALPRVGINYAQEYKDKLWRFKLNNNF